MGVLDILFIGIGVAMDAFAVSICKGLSMTKLNLRKTIIISLFFGFFQALMPVIGFCLGISFEDMVKSIDHWIAFSLLLIIGINMIKETFEEEDDITNDTDFKSMIMLSIATSIDALAVGITFAFLGVNIFFSSSIIGVVTFFICMFGVIIGNKFGSKFEKKARILGGAILIFMGVQILVEHLLI